MKNILAICFLLLSACSSQKTIDSNVENKFIDNERCYYPREIRPDYNDYLLKLIKKGAPNDVFPDFDSELLPALEKHQKSTHVDCVTMGTFMFLVNKTMSEKEMKYEDIVNIMNRKKINK